MKTDATVSVHKSYGSDHVRPGICGQCPRPIGYRSYDSHRPGPKENRKLRSVHVRRATDAKTTSAYVRLSTDIITVSVQVSMKIEARINSVQIQVKTEAIISVHVSQNKKLVSTVHVQKTKTKN